MIHRAFELQFNLIITINEMLSNLFLDTTDFDNGRRWRMFYIFHAEYSVRMSDNLLILYEVILVAKSAN